MKLRELWETAKGNLGFVLVCLLVFAGLFLAARLVEKLLLPQRNRVSKTRYICYVAMFGALAGVIMLAELPLFFAPSFYELDFSEIPILICSFYLGPVAGVTTELIKILVKLLIKGTSTAYVGDFANFVVGCAFVLPASIVYNMKKSKRTALVGCIVGTLCMAVFGSLFNAVYLIPKFSELFKLPLEVIVGMGTEVNARITSVSTLVLFAVVPFNLLKGALVSAVTFLLYKRVERVIFRPAPRGPGEIPKQSET